MVGEGWKSAEERIFGPPTGTWTPSALCLSADPAAAFACWHGIRRQMRRHATNLQARGRSEGYFAFLRVVLRLVFFAVFFAADFVFDLALFAILPS